GVAVDDEPVGAAAVGTDAGVLGERAAAVEGELDARGRGLELDVLAAEAPRDVQAAVDVEALAGLDVVDAEQQHEVVDLEGGRAGVLLRGGGDLPDGPVRGLHDG